MRKISGGGNSRSPIPPSPVHSLRGAQLLTASLHQMQTGWCSTLTSTPSTPNAVTPSSSSFPSLPLLLVLLLLLLILLS